MAPIQLSAAYDEVKKTISLCRNNLTLKQFKSKYGMPTFPKDVAQLREWMNQRGAHNQSLLKNPPFDMLTKNVDVTNTTIELPELPSHQFPVRIYRPKNFHGTSLPVMLYFHGGFWCSGSSNSKDFGCRAIIARGTAILILSFE